jgi:hypothetical protein
MCALDEGWNTLTDHEGLERREFLKISATTAMASALLMGCRKALPGAEGPEKGHSMLPPGATATDTLLPTTDPSPLPAPTETPLGQVALVRTDDRGEGIRRALDLLEVNPVRGKSLFVKPNFNSADPL